MNDLSLVGFGRGDNLKLLTSKFEEAHLTMTNLVTT